MEVSDTFNEYLAYENKKGLNNKCKRQSFQFLNNYRGVEV
jgi:hypothetical protein